MRGRRTDVVVSSPGQRIRDEEGRWRATGEDVVVRAVVQAAMGIVRRQTDLGETAGHGELPKGVVLVPRGTPISTSDVLRIYGSDIPDGTYRVRAISRTPKHVRVAVTWVEER